MLQRKIIGKVSLRHVEECKQGARGDTVCVCVMECRFWSIPDGTFMITDRTFIVVGIASAIPYSFRRCTHDVHFTHLTALTVQSRQSLGNAATC
jgi:hypothetical protein